MSALLDVAPRRPQVLVVDDQPTIRSIVQRVLAEDGYEVLEAESGEAALGLTAELRAPVDLIILDLEMPGMRGDELAARLLAIQPRVPLLFISGTGSDGDADGLASPLLSKPFTIEALKQSVRALVAPGE